MLLPFALSIAVLCGAKEYNLNIAVAAASKAMPAGAPEKYPLYALWKPEDKFNKQLLEFLRAGKGSTAYFVIVSPKTEYVREALSRAMMRAKKEKFTGLHLIIVGDVIAPELFDDFLKDRGIIVSYAAY